AVLVPAAHFAAVRRVGTGRRPHAPRERLRLHWTQCRAAPGGRRLDQVWRVLTGRSPIPGRGPRCMPPVTLMLNKIVVLLHYLEGVAAGAAPGRTLLVASRQEGERAHE